MTRTLRAVIIAAVSVLLLSTAIILAAPRCKPGLPTLMLGHVIFAGC